MKNINEVLFKGFTLLEILIVIVILGVMAGLAVPTYIRNVEQARAEEAKVNLYTIYTAEKVYKVNSRSKSQPEGKYWVPGENQSAAMINKALNINLADPKYYTVFGITPSATGFKATASKPSNSAANYSIWSDQYLQEGSGLAGDFNGNGTVGAEDYTIWADTYTVGKTASIDGTGTYTAPNF